ncbi:hypothetical protein JG688_00015235 [Phytophthora aleatoria]|uniref:Uncharacterized protein n=1 Tax=Phytophthora aleatoria TaxID=2496075 RepID=A0A8J5I5R9_9STRA|nr:hypothetical protein JG688_00015235 [Phytophthora aleatoria]
MARGRGWSAPETLHMLGLVKQILPFGFNLWKTVQLQYEATGEPSIVEPLPRRLKRVVLITSMWTYQLYPTLETEFASRQGQPSFFLTG